VLSFSPYFPYLGIEVFSLHSNFLALCIKFKSKVKLKIEIGKGLTNHAIWICCLTFYKKKKAESGCIKYK
jgi:hypothetical protein